MSIENVKNDVLPRLGACQLRSTLFHSTELCLPRKIRSEVLHVPHGIIIMSQIKNGDSFTKQDFRYLSILSKRLPDSPKTAPATKNDLQNHL